ncbi:MAG TPA: PQQ-binding-like beta-propeller repeat protein [Thermoguttaceae bacterium]|nr:PQQ-binding-like beta-propeller repeat protein [Thermoguttaceae bacterium]
MVRRIPVAARLSRAVLVALILSLSLVGLLEATATAAESPERATAREILDAAGARGGLVVHVGCGDGKLTAALRAGDSYLVHGLDADAGNVEKARETIRAMGLCGKVSAEHWTGERLPYADNLVNLLVLSSRPGEGMRGEVMRVLAPGGVVCVRAGGEWKATVKPRPTEIDEWTHFLHGPDNNAVARDSVVGPPRHLQWVGGPKWARSHDHLATLSAVVSSGGRVFAIVDEGPTAFIVLPAKWWLVARDAFSGVLLWKRPIESWEWHLRGFRSGPPEVSRTLVAIGDRVYVTLGYGEPVTALDAATGETVKTYEGTGGTTEILCAGGVLYLVAGERRAEQAGAVIETWRRGVTPSAHEKRILAIQADTGELVWKKADAATAELMPTTLAVHGGKVFFENAEHVVSLDAKSGDEVWRAERPISRSRLGWSTPTLVVYQDVVLSADRDVASSAREDGSQPEGVEWIPSSAGGLAPVGELIAFSAADGRRLWSCPCKECYNGPVDVLVAGGLVWTGNLVRATEPGITTGRDPATGEVKMERPPDKEFFTVGMGHHRCYRNKATERYLVLGRAGVEFIDVATGKATTDHWTRGTCQYGVMPCNGLLYAPSHSCACYIESKLNGFNALAPQRSEGREASDENTETARLERGPAFDASIHPSSFITHPSEDWPTYRHDAARSGRTDAAVPTTLQRSWQAELGGKLTSPVIADGKVFVAQVDAHTVHALDAESGKPAWSFTAGGRVDGPPTIYRGLALFGCADGWVYCLRASDGELAWRFRAAPEDRRVVAYNQLESAWPVHGSVLVEDGSAYFVAGRSIFLDGGMYLYRLDAVTGEKLAELRMDDRDPETGLEPQQSIRGTHMKGALPDVLSSDGTSIYMRHKRFDRNLAEQEEDVPHLYSSVGFVDDSWWHRTYWLVASSMRSGYGGWPVVGRSAPSGRILALDESWVYGFGRDHYVNHGSHVGVDGTAIFHFRPDRDPDARWISYRLFAVDRQDARKSKPEPEPAAAKRAQSKPAAKPAARAAAKSKAEPAAKPATKPAAKQRRREPAAPPKKYRWTKEVPLLVRAMLLAENTLFVAGPPDDGKLADLPAAWEGKEGGLLCAVSTADGQPLAEYELDVPPVFDGLAAAGGRLYLATQDGKVVCFAGP